MCLDIHLMPLQTILLEDTVFYESYDISTATDEVVQLFESCYNQYVCLQQTEYLWHMDSLKEVYNI